MYPANDTVELNVRMSVKGGGPPFPKCAINPEKKKKVVKTWDIPDVKRPSLAYKYQQARTKVGHACRALLLFFFSLRDEVNFTSRAIFCYT